MDRAVLCCKYSRFLSELQLVCKAVHGCADLGCLNARAMPVQGINLITPVHNIGALSLDTQPLKYSLKSEAVAWKNQFAKNLHKKGSEDLKVRITAWMLGMMWFGGGCCSGPECSCLLKSNRRIYCQWHTCSGRVISPAYPTLQAFDQYLHDMTVKLNRKVEDLDDVRHVMEVLREVRETEANIHTLITPIDDMYSLLLRWVGVHASKPCTQLRG